LERDAWCMLDSVFDLEEFDLEEKDRDLDGRLAGSSPAAASMLPRPAIEVLPTFARAAST